MIPQLIPLIWIISVIVFILILFILINIYYYIDNGILYINLIFKKEEVIIKW